MLKRRNHHVKLGKKIPKFKVSVDVNTTLVPSSRLSIGDENGHLKVSKEREGFHDISDRGLWVPETERIGIAKHNSGKLTGVGTKRFLED